MRKMLILLFFLLTACGFIHAQKENPNQQIAVRFFELMQKDQREQYLSLCDSAVKSALAAPEQSQLWAQTREKFGEFKRVKSMSSETKDGLEIIHQICQFEKIEI